MSLMVVSATVLSMRRTVLPSRPTRTKTELSAHHRVDKKKQEQDKRHGNGGTNTPEVPVVPDIRAGGENPIGSLLCATVLNWRSASGTRHCF